MGDASYLRGGALGNFIILLEDWDESGNRFRTRRANSGPGLASEHSPE